MSCPVPPRPTCAGLLSITSFVPFLSRFCPALFLRNSWHRAAGVGEPPVVAPFCREPEVGEAADGARELFSLAAGGAFECGELVEVEPPVAGGQDGDAGRNVVACDLLPEILAER